MSYTGISVLPSPRKIMKKEGTYPEDFGYTFKAYDWSDKKVRLLASEETLTRVVEKYKTGRL